MSWIPARSRRLRGADTDRSLWSLPLCLFKGIRSCCVIFHLRICTLRIRNWIQNESVRQSALFRHVGSCTQWEFTVTKSWLMYLATSLGCQLETEGSTVPGWRTTASCGICGGCWAFHVDHIVEQSNKVPCCSGLKWNKSSKRPKTKIDPAGQLF